MKNLRKEFIKFLKEHGAFVPFVCNLARKDYGGEPQHTFSSYLKAYKIEYWVTMGFEWDITPQGDNFWNKLHVEWGKRANSLITCLDK